MSDRESSSNSLTTSTTSSKGDEKVATSIPLDLRTPSHLIDTYPKLALTPYCIENENDPINVLSLLHNAAKREISELLSVILPCIKAIPHSDNTADLHPDLIPLTQWWNALIRFFFFVSDTDEDISGLVTTPAIRFATRMGDLHLADRLSKARKSVSDRYAFAMEYVFRAADRALHDYRKNATKEAADKVHVKFVSVVNFMLDSMHASTEVVNQAYAVCEVSLYGLQRKTVDSLCSFAKDRRNIYMYMCARWMNDEHLIKKWILKYGGFKGRMFYDSWKIMYAEERATFLKNITEKHLPTQSIY